MAETIESQQTVKALLLQWVSYGRLSYKFHVIPTTSGCDAAPRMLVTFSKPTIQTPAPEAVVQLCFHLTKDRQRVRGFTIENDPHFNDIEAVEFDEAVLDRVIRRKLQLRAACLVDLSDEFSSTRVPSIIRAREEDQREYERKVTEEYLFAQMEGNDSFNDGKLQIEIFRKTVNALKLSSSVAPREILLALVASDRDDLVAYSDFVSVAAEMIDTMSACNYADRATNDKASTMCADEEEKALDAFEVLSARQTHYTVEKVNALVEAHAERIAEAAAIKARRETSSVLSEETKGGENEEEAVPEAMSATDKDLHETAGDESSTFKSPDCPTLSAKELPRMSRYQLRGLLETPQLLLSEAEINLTLALANTMTNLNGVEEVLCDNLGSLLRRVRRMIFCFQLKSFVDRIEIYLLKQFQAFERRGLQGSSKHLKQRLMQKDVKAALKSMQKLLLTPYQLMQLVALTEERAGAPEHMVCYKDLIPRLARLLGKMVKADVLADRSAHLHVWDPTTVSLPSEGAVRQASFDCFVKFDHTRLGAISIDDFYQALNQLAHVHNVPVNAMTEMKQLSALADPNGNGRVNYTLFQHLMYPLLLYLDQERKLAVAEEGS